MIEATISICIDVFLFMLLNIPNPKAQRVLREPILTPP
jgi:hypothetical protein